ncbi:MAG: hypothetical protein HN710_05015 [Candidatus Marinimicrobia bacterium]|jgi:hypothetical protein|nr:hypothetical protein [Candidatus Neomarinimicrobiota bacterium]
MKRLGILLVLMLTTVSYSQYYEGNTVIAWSKYKFKPVSEVDGHKAGDRGKALLEYHTARNAKTKLLQSSLFLTHYWTGKVTDVNFLNEFKNMEDATLYSGTGGDLNEKTWPNEDERKAAVSGNNKYFQRYHEDVHLFENRKKLEKKKKKSKDNPNTVVAVTTRYWKPLSQVEGGSADERDKLMQKYHKKVTMKNDKIISQRTVTHLWTGALSNGYYPITRITEFASMADADDLETGPKLYEKAFKSKEDREAFNKYWAPASHEDIGLFWNQSRYNKLK